MGRSLTIGTFAGIPLKFHWTYSLVVVFLAYFGLSQGWNGVQTVAIVSMVIVLFLSVVLHEYGHALTAKRYGILTKDIILTPIGGIARLTRIPKEPKKELWITIMGPAVNFIISITLGLLYLIIFGIYIPDLTYFEPVPPVKDIVCGCILTIIVLNGSLGLFNLAPVFPMDGGRILRAFLAMRFTHERATVIASTIGQIFAIGFVALGMFNKQPTLGAIGAFIFLAARSEFKNARFQQRLQKTKAGDITSTNYQYAYTSDSIFVIKEKLKSAPYLILLNEIGDYQGYLRPNALMHLNHLDDQTAIGSINNQGVYLLEDQFLNTRYQDLKESKQALWPVYDRIGTFKGIIDVKILQGLQRA